MVRNPLKWPEFEQIGREFHECLQPALRQLSRETSREALHDKAARGLQRLESWLSAPCAATVKINGSNVGIDNRGLMVGRNLVIEQGDSYQRVDVRTVLEGYSEKAELFRAELQGLAGGEDIEQVMLYGELCVLGRYDYTKAGIFKGWLCFGAILSQGTEDKEGPRRLTAQLRTHGYNARALLDKVLVSPNAQLEATLARLDVPTVFGSYRPTGVTEEQWSTHDGQGSLPRFKSMRQLLLSDWAQRLLLPADGVPLCEGLVVCSEADGTLFKWKHGGEELGKVPEQLESTVRQLRELGDCQLLPESILAICERLLLVATTRPQNNKLPKVVKEEDTEALAVWESSLTKYDSLEEVFQRGPEAKAARESELIRQVAMDLVKDYGATEEAAQKRAVQVVRAQVGRSFSAWRKAQGSGA
mmetsp:Transcript_30357/g.66460  ORF Transcript_30357/g.66460 Transcript_30357/m.66460 type:complete len:416 (+) Transcript_30357:65-1312(+)